MVLAEAADKEVTKEEIIIEIQTEDIKSEESLNMPKIGNPKSISEIACDRCGSRRKVSKTWIEQIKNDHGGMVLRHTKIICTNKECQSAFEKIILEDGKKREKLKQIKIDNAAKRITVKTTIQAAAKLTN